MLSCSKGARGLSVLPRERCIFTAISTSLSLGWRQCGHHYAIRAGRNLPDKEFRYLRTVIVTAAVYRGFDQELAPPHLTFRHRAGVRPYTSTFVFAEPCRSYGVNLPSSFTRGLSSAWEYSSCPPVSVWGTVTTGLCLEAFLGS